jgi:hypothetical protein
MILLRVGLLLAMVLARLHEEAAAGVVAVVVSTSGVARENELAVPLRGESVVCLKEGEKGMHSGEFELDGDDGAGDDGEDDDVVESGLSTVAVEELKS